MLLLLGAAPGATQERTAGTAPGHADEPPADVRLARLRGMEKVLAMEVGAVDALTKIEHDRERRRGHDLLSDMRRMGLKYLVQLEEGDEGLEGEDEFAGMKCKQTAAMYASASTAAERERVCGFVEARCAPKTGFFNYLSLPYCSFSWAPWLGSVAMMAFLVIAFIWLVAMVDFLIPALATLSKLCMLRQSVAGVTFLAFGNGCSDIFSMTAATLTGVKGMELAIGEVLGNGMLIFCGIQGIIAIITPFTANASEYLRDCAFYGMALLLTCFVLFDGHMSAVEGGLFLGLYLVYVLVVVNYEKVLNVLGLDPLEPEEFPHLNASAATERENLMEEPGEKQWEPTVDELYSHVTPVTARRFWSMEWYEKALIIVQAPVVVVLRLTVPVVSDELPKDGWSRPVSTMKMLLLPLLIAAFFCTHVLPAMRVAWVLLVAGLGLCVGVTLAILMWINTEDDKPPAWHKGMCFVGFVAAVLFIYMTAAEIVNIILAFGVVYELGNFSLGVSILAIGIGMQDLVSNIGVARAGLPNMAASACVGAPLLNILLGLGVCAIAGNILVANPYPLHLTTQLIVCLAFLCASVFIAVSFMVYSNFQAGTTLGVLLVSLYVVFLVTTLALDGYNPSEGDLNSVRARESETFGEAIGEGVR